MKTHPCVEDDASFDPAQMKTLPLQNSLCLDQKNFTLEGYWDEGELKYLDVYLLKCNNETSNNTCKNQEQIQSTFGQLTSNFGVNYQGLSMDLNDFEKPFRRKHDSIYQLIDFNIVKRLKFFFKKWDVITDDGWFFSQKTPSVISL